MMMKMGVTIIYSTLRTWFFTGVGGYPKYPGS